MSYKCPFCPRYFSTRSAYTQHKNFCTPPNNDSSDSEELEEFEHKTNHDVEVKKIGNYKIFGFYF